MAQTVKRLPTKPETWVQSLGWEDLLEKEMATHTSILAWKIPRMEEPGRLQSMGSQSQTRLSGFTFTFLLTEAHKNCTMIFGKRRKESEVVELCATLCDSVGCSLLGSSVHEILEARILEWVAVFFSRRSSQPRD